jgi:hypothetical protein
LISIQTFGESFGGLASYLETGESRVDPAQRVGWMDFRNLPTERMDVAVPIMRGTASLSGTQQPVFHLSISWAPGDPVNRELMHEVIMKTLSDLGLREHQAVILEHIDTDNPHVHAMVNRVHPETGVAWKGSWSKLRAEASLRRQEVERGLRVVPGWLASVPGAPELRPQPRLARGDAEFLQEVQECAGPVLERAQSWSELEAGLSEFRLSVRVNGRGMSVTDGRREVKASEVGRQFSRGNLEKRLGRYSDYSARVAVASAAAVRSHADASGNIEIPKDGFEHRAAAGLHPRFRLHEDGGRIGVLDQVGPQLFFTATWEQALAEAERASKIVARYPNIVTVRGLAAMDARWRQEHALEPIAEPGRMWAEPPSPGAPSSAPVVAASEPSLAPESAREEAVAPGSVQQLSFTPDMDPEAAVRVPARRQSRTRKTHSPVSASQDDLWSQAPTSVENPGFVEAETSLNAASAQVDSDEAAEPPPAQHVSAEIPVKAAPAVPVARPRQRKPRQSRTRSASEAQVDLWSQASAPDQTMVPAPDQSAARESAPGVAIVAQTTPVSGVAGPLEPVAAPKLPRVPEQQDQGVAQIESLPQPQAADRYSDIAARIEDIRRTAFGGAMPAADDDSLAARVARARATAAPAPGRDQQARVPEQVGAPLLNPSREPGRKEDAARLSDGSRAPGVSRKAEDFLRTADRVLERKALLDEAQDAVAEIGSGHKWSIDLDRVDAHLRGSRNDFKAWVQTTFQDPQAFLEQYEAMRAWEQRMMLDSLRKSPEAFARQLVRAQESEIASRGKRVSGWRAAVTRAAKHTFGKSPEQRVFKNVPGFENDCRLVADAGERYMSAVTGCENAHRYVADALGIEDTAPPEEVRKAITAHVDRAKVRKAQILERYDALDDVPTTKALRRSFRALSLKDKGSVLEQLGTIGKLLPQALSLVIELAEGPDRGRGGWSL